MLLWYDSHHTISLVFSTVLSTLPVFSCAIPSFFPQGWGCASSIASVCGEQERMEAVCVPSSHLRLILFLLLPDKVLKQNKTALWGVSVDAQTLREEWMRSTVVLVVQNHKSQESGGRAGACAFLHCSFLVRWRHQGQVSQSLKERIVRGKKDPFPHPFFLKLCSSLSMTFDSIMTDSNLLFLEHDPGCILVAAFYLNLSVPLGTHSFEFPRIPRQEYLTSNDSHCWFRFKKIFAFLELLQEESLFS